MKAGSTRSILRRLVDNNGITRIEKITQEQIAYFIGQEISQFFIQSSLIAIRGFLRYCQTQGHPCISPHLISMENLTRLNGRPRLLKFEREVKSIIATSKRPLTVRAVKEKMEKKHQRSFAVSSIHRWAKR